MRRFYVLFLALILHHTVLAYPSVDQPLTRHGKDEIPIDAIAANERDGEASKKIIGSSVVTSVSVILNGDEPEFQDAVGKKVPKPVAPLVASPINLLNPDRYEFYTFDDNGELVKRLMTLKEIQSIVANGDGEGPAIIHSISIDSRDPEKNVRDIVASVQSVLTKEVEGQRNSSESAPVLDTPDVSSSWSMILPAIFGNTGGDIFPQTKPQQVVMTPDSDVVESTTKPHKQRPRPRPKPSKNKRKPSTTRKPVVVEEEVAAEQEETTQKKRPTTQSSGDLEASTGSSTKPQKLKPKPTGTTTKKSPSQKKKPRPTTQAPLTESEDITAPVTHPAKKTKKPTTTATTAGIETTTKKVNKKKKPTTTTQTPQIASEDIEEVETTTKAPKVRTTTTVAPVTTTNVVVVVGEETTKKPIKITTTPAPLTTTTTEKFVEQEATITPLVDIVRETTTTTPAPVAAATEPSIVRATSAALLATKATTMSPMAITNILNSLKDSDDDLNTKLSFDQILQSLKEELEKDESTETSVEFESTTAMQATSSDNVEITHEKIIEVSTVAPEEETTTAAYSESEADSEQSSEADSNSHSVKFEPVYADIQEPLITELTTTETPFDEISTQTYGDFSTTFSMGEDATTTDATTPLDSQASENQSSLLSQEIDAIISNNSEQIPEVQVNSDRLTESLAHHESIASMSMAEFQQQVATIASNAEDVVPTTTADPQLDSGETKNEIEFLMSDVINQMTDGLVTTSAAPESANRLSNFAQISTSLLNGMKPSVETQALHREELATATVPTLFDPESTTASPIPTTTEEYPEAWTTTSRPDDEDDLDVDSSTDAMDSGEVDSREDILIETTTILPQLESSSTEIAGEMAVVLTDSDMENSSSEQIFDSTTQRPLEEATTQEISLEAQAYFKLGEEKETTTTTTTTTTSTTTSTTPRPVVVTHFLPPPYPSESKPPVGYSSNQQRPLVRPANLSNLKVSLHSATRPPVVLDPTPISSPGLEASTTGLEEDIQEFARLCNELAFAYWKAITSEKISSARSLVISPFALTSMLSMVFLGARGGTSGEMNEVLKLDDMVTFNPHLVFKNITDSVEKSSDSEIASSAFVREIFSDRANGRVLQFFKEKTQQLYAGHVEEVNFHVVNDIIRRRTNLLVKRHTMGKVLEYLRTNSVWVNGPLATISANLFQTDCSRASTAERDGEMFFQVHPSIRQRRLVPIPAVVYKSGFTAGYYPGLDATVVAFGRAAETVSTIYVMPGQQGTAAPGDNLERLETNLVETAFSKGAWSQLLSTLTDRPGLEVQLPRFSHRSFINASLGLQKMGLKGLFNSDFADLRGLTGSSNKDVFLSDMIQINTFSTCGEAKIGDHHHVEMYPAPPIRKRNKDVDEDAEFDSSESVIDFGSIVQQDSARGFYDDLLDPKYLELPLPLRPRQARIPDAPRLRFDKPFLYFVRHNPTGMILFMGRFNPRLLP